MADSRRREPLRGALIAIVAAAIAAGGTLAGNALASANARDQLAAQIEHEDSVRQDDLRRDAYKRFISVASKYEVDLRRFSLISTEKEVSSTNQTIATDISEIEAVWSEVQLVGSAKAAGLAGTVRDALNQITNNAGGIDFDEIGLRAQRVEPKIRLFINAAREELNK
jgi:hypothetical protein